MIRTEPLTGIAMTSFGSIVGRTVRKEPLVNQIEVECYTFRGQ